MLKLLAADILDASRGHERSAMHLVWATSDFRLSGRPYEGFPILLDEDMCGVEPANRFLRFWLLHRGRSASKKSWPTIGQHLADYFEFLERAGLRWNVFHGFEGESPVAAYRHEAIEVRGLHPRTVNQRLGTVLRFYVYAREQNWTTSLPFRYEKRSAQRHGSPGILGHLSRGRGSATPDVMMRVQKAPIEYLARDQIEKLLRHLKNPTHKLMTRVGLQTGLRREEIASLPVAYIQQAIAEVAQRNMVKIRLDPRDGSGQKTKGSRERVVFFPSTLIADLWGYVVHERARIASRSATGYPQLFLTAQGEPWASDGKGFSRVLTKLSASVGVEVHPHLLRHTYATYTLAALQQRRDGLDPLVYVQRQLGHSSIETTLCYAHLASEIAIAAVTAYDMEITQWSR